MEKEEMMSDIYEKSGDYQAEYSSNDGTHMDDAGMEILKQ